MKEVEVFVCSFCKELFENNDAITCHILNAHSEITSVRKLRKQLKLKNTTPPTSSKTAKKSRSSDRECKVRKYGMEFYCDICNYKTVYRSTYQRHLLTHEKDGRQHKCMHCSYSAVQANNLKIHLETVHPFGAVDPVVVEYQ